MDILDPTRPHRASRLAALLLCWGLCGSLILRAAQPADRPSGAEPEVSQAEATLLQEAAQRAAASPAEAAAFLRGRILPDSSAALPFAVAAYSLEAGREADAVAALEDALQRHPPFQRARSNLAKLLAQQERYADAAAQLRLLIGVEGRDGGEIHALLGFCLLALGHPESAETAYRQALLWRPDDPNLTAALLKCLIEQGRTAEAAPLARKQLERDPRKAAWWQVLAGAAMETGRSDTALVLLECAHRLGAVEGDLTVTLGDLYLDQGMYREAAAAYAGAETATPTRLLRAADALLQARRTAEAVHLLTALQGKAADLPHPDAQALRRLQARAALDSGDQETGVERIRAALQSDPLDGEALLLLAANTANPAEARESYRRATTLKGCELRAFTGLARLEVGLGNYRDALAAIDRALAIAPDARLQRYREQILEAARSAPEQ